MSSPDDDLRDFIRNYYYGEVSDATVAADANELMKFMRERGWDFERIPADAR